MRWLLRLPCCSLLEKRVTRVRWYDNDSPLIVEQLRNCLFRCARGCKSTVEDVALPLDFTGNCLDVQCNSGYGIGKLDAVEMSTNQSHPRFPARSRSRWPNEMLVRRSICEREHEHHLARAKSPRLECARDAVDERIDHEHKTLRICKRVIHPVHRRMRQVPRHCSEYETIVVRARETPQ